MLTGGVKKPASPIFFEQRCLDGNSLSYSETSFFNFRGYIGCDLGGDKDRVTLVLDYTRTTPLADCPIYSKRNSSIAETYTYAREQRTHSISGRRNAFFIVSDERKIRCRCCYRGVELLDFRGQVQPLTDTFHVAQKITDAMVKTFIQVLSRWHCETSLN